MSKDSCVNEFVVHNFNFMYKLLGYEECLRQLQLIHHIHSNVSIPSRPNHVDVEEVAEESVKNIIIDPIVKESYQPASLADEDRCSRLLKNGNRCGIRRKKSSEFCSHHDREAHK